MTLDNCDNPNIPLGPAETLLLDAVDSRFAYHGSSADEVSGALLAQARAKVPGPPDFIAADASAQRMHLAKDAGALALGVDTADTIQAANSAERMLAHQLAAAHAGAMQLMGQVANMMVMQGTAIRTDDGANLRVTRLAGAASRLMIAFQQGLVTLDKLRAGGKQTILVQHVQVNDGGHAVVAGKVRGGADRGVRRAAVSSSPSASRNNSGSGGKGRK